MLILATLIPIERARTLVTMLEEGLDVVFPAMIQPFMNLVAKDTDAEKAKANHPIICCWRCRYTNPGMARHRVVGHLGKGSCGAESDMAVQLCCCGLAFVHKSKFKGHIKHCKSVAQVAI